MYLTRSEEVRCSNEHIANQAVRLRFVARVPMLCECSDPACQTIVLIDLDQWNKLSGNGFFVTAPDHTVEHATLTARGDGYWLQRLTTPMTSPSERND